MGIGWRHGSRVWAQWPAPADVTQTAVLRSAQAAAVSGVLQRTLGWGVQLVTDLGSDSDDEDGPVVVEGVEVPDN